MAIKYTNCVCEMYLIRQIRKRVSNVLFCAGIFNDIIKTLPWQGFYYDFISTFK